MRGGGDGGRRGPVGVGEAAGRHDGQVGDGGEDDGAVRRRDHHGGRRRRRPVRRRRGRAEGVAFGILQDMQAGRGGEGRQVKIRELQSWELKIREVEFGEIVMFLQFVDEKLGCICRVWFNVVQETFLYFHFREPQAYVVWFPILNHAPWLQSFSSFVGLERERRRRKCAGNANASSLRSRPPIDQDIISPSNNHIVHRPFPPNLSPPLSPLSLSPLSHLFPLYRGSQMNRDQRY